MKRIAWGLLSWAVSTIAAAQSCGVTLNVGANVAATVAAASSGSVVCLNAGTWGAVTFSGITKTAYVTIRSTTGSGASISPSVIDSKFLRFSSLTVPGFLISGAQSSNIAVTSSTVTGMSSIDIASWTNASILIDGNTFNGIDKGASSFDGRLTVRTVSGTSSTPGVTIARNSFGGGGCSDGLRLEARGVAVGPGNVFSAIVQGACVNPAQVDALQGAGISNTRIIGNSFSGNTSCIRIDGGSGDTIEHNLIVGGCVVDFGSMTGLTFNHNTLRNVSARVGAINLPGAGSGTLSNSVMHDSSFSAGPLAACSACTFSGNLFVSGGVGTGNVIGTPSYVGGANPSTWGGWRLAGESPGRLAASDGKDMGTLFFNPASPVLSPGPPIDTATLKWDAVNDPRVHGYRVYWGTSPGAYFQAKGSGIDVGRNTLHIVTSLSRGVRYYFSVTAYSQSEESDYAVEVTKAIP